MGQFWYMAVNFGPLLDNFGNLRVDFWIPGSPFSAAESQLWASVSQSLAPVRKNLTLVVDFEPPEVDFMCLGVELGTLGVIKKDFDLD